MEPNRTMTTAAKWLRASPLERLVALFPWLDELQNAKLKSDFDKLLIACDIQCITGKIFQYLLDDPFAVANLRTVSRNMMIVCEPLLDVVFARVTVTYPPSTVQEWQFDSPAFLALQRIRAHVRHVAVKLLPTRELPKRPFGPLLNCMLHPEKLDQVTITLLPEESDWAVLIDPSLALKDMIALFSDTAQERAARFPPASSHSRPLAHVLEAIEGRLGDKKSLSVITFRNLSLSAVESIMADGRKIQWLIRASDKKAGELTLPGFRPRRSKEAAAAAKEVRLWKKIRSIDCRFVRWWDLGTYGVGEATSKRSSWSQLERRDGATPRASFPDTSITGETPCRTHENRQKPSFRHCHHHVLDSRASTPLTNQQKEARNQGMKTVSRFLEMFKESTERLTLTWCCPKEVLRLVNAPRPVATHRALLENFTPEQTIRHSLEWRSCSGPNLFLADEGFSGIFARKKAWTALKALRFDGSPITEREVERIKAKAPRLASFIAPVGRVSPSVVSRHIFLAEHGVVAAEVDLGREIKKTVVFSTGSVAATAAGGPGSADTVREEIDRRRASWMF